MLERTLDTEALNKPQHPITHLTLNLGCLPGGGIGNSQLLKSNKTRLDVLIPRLNQWNDSPPEDMPAPSVIAFQEAFDLFEHVPVGKKASKYFTRHHLKDGLKKHYPYNSDHLGDRLRESGLLLFSKFPIIKADDLTGSFFQSFTNVMFGHEQLALKGFIRVKLQVDDKHFITVYTTHLEAGGAFAKSHQAEHHGTTEARRNTQLGDIYQDMATKRKITPTGSTLTYQKSFLMGDLNDAYNDEKDAYGISPGGTKCAFEKGLTMYPDRQHLFKELVEFNVPENFINIWTESKDSAGGKVIDQKKVAEAKEKNFFTGSCIAVEKLKDNIKQDTPVSCHDTQSEMIDVLVASKDGAEGTMKTRLLLFNQLDGRKHPELSEKFLISDHYPIYGQWTPKLFKVEPATNFVSSNALDVNNSACTTTSEIAVTEKNKRLEENKNRCSIM